ncbi:DUF3450 family protein [Photobacterium chitinilyticum]|uniref:DUF3450 family protein n=1 Tax=Photobacterium chitinilyticum TaxID=2485123 RepID=A0A3S3UKN9_9GAMM|nr:DUF3450 family protein [Photobacterium chitinilyticum]RWX56209.1 DUF3450 family protein [Photobacterium chitinilyticum]
MNKKLLSSVVLSSLLWCTPSWGSTAQEMDALVKQWMETETARADLQSRWAAEKQQISSLIKLYQAEKKALTDKVTSASVSASEVDQTRIALAEQQDGYEANAAQAERILAHAKTAMTKLWPWLPVPLQRQLEEANASLLDTSASLANHMQSLLSMLDEMQRFNAILTLNKEILTLENGKQVAVEQLYLGLSQAWFISSDGKTAGIGSTSAEGWQWQVVPEYADAIAEALAVFKRTRQASFVDLPVIASKVAENDDVQ